MYKNFWKRFIDILLSSLGIVLLSPLFLLLSILIKLDDPGPVFFKQKRVGRNKTYFWLYKFRSMKVNTPELPTHLLKNPQQYISRVGHFLRKTSLDELPQLWNILKGDMSIIGPRPVLWSQEDLIVERDRYGANDVRPGLTGWAQINGRDELKIEDKARLDGEYVKRLEAGKFQGIGMDLHCFFGTVVSVIKADGIVEGDTDVAQTEETEVIHL